MNENIPSFSEKNSHSKNSLNEDSKKLISSFKKNSLTRIKDSPKRLSFHKFDLSLSINTDEPKRKSIKNKRFSVALGSFEPEIKRTNTRTRHLSLLYATRNKYVTEKSGKSFLLTKVMRPIADSDHKLQMVEGQLDQLEDHTPDINSLLKKNSILKESNFKKESIGGRGRKKSVLKTTIDNQIFNLNVLHQFESNESPQIARKTSLSEENDDMEDRLEGQEDTDIKFEEIEMKIYDFLENEQVFYIIVNQREAYSEKIQKMNMLKVLQKKKNPIKDSPLLKRRGNNIQTPTLNGLKIALCTSSDNLTKLYNFNEDN